MEVLVVLAVIAVLAAIALPNYASSVKKSRAQGAGADLATLALNMDNKLQLQLTYPIYESDTVASTTLFPGWSPAMQAFFSYTVQSTTSSYELKASGYGAMSGCTLTLNSTGTRTASGNCGLGSW